MRRLAFLLAILLLPSVAAEEGLTWAEVREVTLDSAEAPSIWGATAACGAVLAVFMGVALFRSRR